MPKGRKLQDLSVSPDHREQGIFRFTKYGGLAWGKKKKKKSPKLGNMGDTLIEEKNRTKRIFPPNQFKGPCFECPEAGALG